MSAKNKKRSRKKKAVVAARDWSRLPPDVVGLIASRLDVVSETIFLSAFRTCSSATYRHLPDFSDASSPWLLYFPRNQSTCRVLNPLCGRAFNTVFPSELAGFRILSSRDGWLLMERARGCDRVNFLLFNPLTQRIISEIPEVPILSGFSKTWFNFPSSEECTIVGFRHWGDTVSVETWRLGEEEWEIHEMESDPCFYPISLGGITSRGRKFYCLGANGSVAVINFKDVVKRWTIWNIPLQQKSPCTLFSPCYLAESNGGALLGVFETIQDKTIRILRLNLKKKLWEEIKHLGNQTLFLSNGRCLSMVFPRLKKLHNKIFFPKAFVGDTNKANCVFYCLATKKFASLNGEFSSKSAHLARDYQHSCWFIP